MEKKENKRAAAQKRSTQRTVMWLALFVALMFGFGYAMVPLYNVICQITGINGKTVNRPVANIDPVDKSRWVTVEFIAAKNANLAWAFHPLVNKIQVHPGENKLIAYFAENQSGHTMTVQAVPSVTPGSAARYLKKTECFCFVQQTLKNGEHLDMPLMFHIDRDLPRTINTVTLAYTLFDASGVRARPPEQTGRI